MTTSSSIFDALFNEVTQGALTRHVSVLHDAAINLLPIPARPLATYREFEDLCIRVVQNQRAASAGRFGDRTVPPEAALARAKEIIGDWESAAIRCMDGSEGGAREVVNELWRKLKEEHETQWVEMVIDQAVHPLDPKAKLQLAQEILDRFGPFLPPDLRAKQAWELCANYRGLVKLMASLMNAITRALSDSSRPHSNAPGGR
jgi:hypothetical protein